MVTSLRSNLSLADMDRASHLHPFTNLADLLRDGPTIISKGYGATLWDSTGKEYVDGAAGLWCVNVGYGREEIVEAIAKQARELSFGHSFNGMTNEPAVRLADEIISLAPANMRRVFFGNSGSDANDTNVKLVWFYNNLRGLPRKKKIISRHRGYHGVTVAAGSCTGLPGVHGRFDLPIPQVLHVSEPDTYRRPAGMSEREYSSSLAKELEQAILREGPETVAAFIAEPVMGTGGVLLPPEGYFAEIKQVLDRYEVLLILDEVISGFGRTGTWFAADKYGVEPDLMTIAKGMTSGYVPLSGSIIGDRVWSVLESQANVVGVLGHGFTYSGHPLAAAAALANLEVLKAERLIERVSPVGENLLRQLRERCADHPLVGDIRGVGLMVGLEIVEDRATKRSFSASEKVGARVARSVLRHGALARALPLNDVIALSPPFIVSPAEIGLLVERVFKGLQEVTEQLVKEGIRVH